MPAVRPWILLLLLAPLAGCATLGEADCLQGDWYGIGEADALAGHSHARLRQHQDACARHGAVADPSRYAQGYGEGLLGFCVPDQGFALGRRGASYHGLCPEAREAAFLPAYALGRDVYGIDAALIALDSDIAQLRDEISDSRTSDVSREVAGRELEARKRERGRLQQQRDDRLSLARSLGYGNVW